MGTPACDLQVVVPLTLDRRKAKPLACLIISVRNNDNGGGPAMQEDILWSLGCLFSRAYGSGDQVGLAPYIDLLNHRGGSLKPMPYEFEGLEKYQSRTTSALEVEGQVWGRENNSQATPP